MFFDDIAIVAITFGQLILAIIIQIFDQVIPHAEELSIGEACPASDILLNGNLSLQEGRWRGKRGGFTSWHVEARFNEAAISLNFLSHFDLRGFMVGIPVTIRIIYSLLLWIIVLLYLKIILWMVLSGILILYCWLVILRGSGSFVYSIVIIIMKSFAIFVVILVDINTKWVICLNSIIISYNILMNNMKMLRLY